MEQQTEIKNDKGTWLWLPKYAERVGRHRKTIYLWLKDRDRKLEWMQVGEHRFIKIS